MSSKQTTGVETKPVITVCVFSHRGGFKDRCTAYLEPIKAMRRVGIFH